MDLSSPVQVLSKAVSSLAESAEPRLKERLLGACMNSALILRVEEFPDDLQPQFRKIHDVLRRMRNVRKEPTLKVATDLTDEQVMETIGDLVHFLVEVAQRQGAKGKVPGPRPGRAR